PTRAWEFALGGLACLLPKQRLATPTRLMRVLGWAGLAAILASGSLYSAEMQFPGYVAILPIAGTVAAVISGGSGGSSALQFLLRSSVLQYLGRLSYSWYLWHWPILLLAAACFPTLTWAQRLLPATIALGLSQITFWLVEKPIRFNPFLVARPVLSLGIALIV